MTSLKITGFKRLDKKLTEMPRAMRRKPLRKATREVAKFTLHLAKQEAPEGEEGNLVRSLKVKAAKRSRRLKNVVATNVETSEGWFKGDEFYAGFMELGTKQRATKEGWNRGAIDKEKHWFLRPALYTFVEKKKRIFVRAVHQWINSQKSK